MNKNKAEIVQPIISKTIWRLLFGVLLLLLTICMIRPCFQNDTFYIIKLGEQLLDKGIVLNDYWAWSAQLVNTYPHFLLNLIFALLYRSFGFFGIYVFVLVIGYAFSLSLYYMIEKTYDSAAGNKNPSLYPLVGTIVSVIVIVVFPTFILARSQLITYPLWLWEAWFILCFLNSGKKRYAIAIIVIAWLCALVHATAWYFTFILFLPFFASVIVTRLGTFISSRNIDAGFIIQNEKFILSNENECSNSKKLLLIMLISYATGLLTPTRLCYTSVFKASSGITINYIAEHQPLVLAEMKYVLIGLLLFIVLMSVIKSRCRLDLLFLFGGTFVMSVMSKRHVGLLVFLGWFALFYLLFSIIRFIPAILKNRLSMTVTAIIIPIAFLILGIANNNITPFYFFDSSFVSAEAIDYLEENYDAQQLRLFNSYSYGAYMLFRDIPVFIDSRVNEYTQEFDPSLDRDVLNDYLTVISLDSNWREVVDYYDFDGYYISKNTALYEILLMSPDVEIVWENDTMVIFMAVGNTKAK